MKHLTRDFLTLPSASCPGTNMYALAMFLLGCGNYGKVGQTNFDLSQSGFLVSEGVGASINTLAGVKDVGIPSGSHVVSQADVNRILVLKSQNFPTHNSGLFRIKSINSASNTMTIDYRTNDNPPSEQSMSWQLYVDELTASLNWKSGSNGTSGYGSFNYALNVSASASRLMLQSPDLSSWQLRLCLESLQDVNGTAPSGFSIAPGFGGRPDGDFSPLPAGTQPGHNQHLYLHTGFYFNTTSSNYRGTVVGLTPLLSSSPGSLWAKGQWRISMVVDDVSGSVGIINQNVNLPIASSGSGWAAFGLCLDEQNPPSFGNLSDPTINCSRLFVVGSSTSRSNLTWKSQFHVDGNQQVVGFGKRGYPIPGVLSCYSDISNPSSHVRYLTSSADSPWNASTELLDVDVLLGTVDQTVAATFSQVIFPIQPRRLGRLPFFMQGRANYPAWSTTTDSSSSYYHALDGVFLEWGGPKPTDSVSGSAFIATISSAENLEGLLQFSSNVPGSDPFIESSESSMIDLDATRYRKTYSYYRQVPVNVGYVKGGSNPAKP